MKRVTTPLVALLLFVSLGTTFQYAFPSTMPAASLPGDFDWSCYFDQVSTDREVYNVGDTPVVYWTPPINKAATLALSSPDPPYTVLHQHTLTANAMGQGTVTLEPLNAQDVGTLILQIFIEGCSYPPQFSGGSTHFQVEPKKGPQGALTGRITDPFDRPVANATVKLFWHPDSTQTAPNRASRSGYETIGRDQKTDLNGDYSFLGIPIPGSGFIEITLDSTYFEVEDYSNARCAECTAKFEYPSGRDFPISSEKPSSKMDIKMVNDTQSPAPTRPELSPYTHAGTIAAAYVNTFESISFWINKLGITSFKSYHIPVKAYASLDPLDCTYCFAWTRRGNLAPPYIAVDADIPQNSPNSEFHEVAHYVMWLEFGGERYMGTPLGSRNHWGFVNPSSKDAFQEGFATFFGQVAWNSANDNTEFFDLYFGEYLPSEPLGWYYPVNQTEYDLTTGRPRYIGSSEEMALASILWSLYSPESLMPLSKTNPLPITSIWKILSGIYVLPQTGQTPIVRHIETISDLYDVLASQDVRSTYNLERNRIDSIFAINRVLQKEATGVRIGLDNPSGCLTDPATMPENLCPMPGDIMRPDRRIVPVLEDSNIIVQSNPGSLPYTLSLVYIVYNGTILIRHFSFSRNITQTSQKIYIWMPDYSLPDATVSFVASKPGYSNVTVATMSGKDYWSNLGRSSSLMTTQPVSFQSPSPTPSPLGGLAFLILVVIVVVVVAALWRRRAANVGKQPARRGTSQQVQGLGTEGSRPSLTPGLTAEGTKFCMACGVRIPATYRFCGSCGGKQD